MFYPMAESTTIQQRIDEIDKLLASGVRTVSFGDRSTEYDLKSLRDERARLMRQLPTGNSTFRRVVFKNG